MGSRIEMKVLEDSSDGKKEISDDSDITFDDLYVINNLYNIKPLQRNSFLLLHTFRYLDEDDIERLTYCGLVRDSF